MWAAVMGYSIAVAFMCFGLALAFNFRDFARWYARTGNRLFFDSDSRFDVAWIRIFGALMALAGPLMAALLTYALVRNG
jgi:hypothetical protein